MDLDAALDLTRWHGLDATYDGRPMGSFGCAAFFSSEETKTISTTMGGMVVTDDQELAERWAAFQQRCAPLSWRQTANYLLKLVLYHWMTEPHVHQYTRAIYEYLGKRNPLPQPTSVEKTKGSRPANYEQRLIAVRLEWPTASDCPGRGSGSLALQPGPNLLLSATQCGCTTRR